MVRMRVSITLVLIGLLFPSAVAAHRRATTAERSAVLTAVVHQRQLSRAQAACQVVTISTVNRAYAALSWPTKLSKACARVAANGVIIEHKKAARWNLVTVGSSLRCPVKGVPSRVASDLRVCH